MVCALISSKAVSDVGVWWSKMEVGQNVSGVGREQR